MPAPVSAVRHATRPSAVALQEHPCSDGNVLTETEPHANSIVAMRDELQWRFEARPGVYAAGLYPLALPLPGPEIAPFDPGAGMAPVRARSLDG